MLTRCAVLGRPIAHSLSPVMHRTAYTELGLADWTYAAFDVGEEQLAGFIGELDGSWRGLSLTMPLKRAVMPLLDEVGERARSVDAANTVVLGHHGVRGDNTDVPGAVHALGERGVERVEQAVVLGAGATAASMVAALRELGLARLTIAVRDARRAAPLAERAGSWGIVTTVEPLGTPAARDADAVVSTVPAGAVDAYAADLVRHAGAVLDVVYDPWPTALATAAAAADVSVISGLDLLAHQAALQVDLMTGQPVPAGLLRTAALAALRAG